MATPAFRAAGTTVFAPNNIVTPTALALTAPAGRVAGDLLLLFTWCRSITATVATPSGYNLVSGFPKRSGTASGGSVYVFSRIADGTAADSVTPSWASVTTGTSGDASGGAIIAWQNASAVLDGTVASSDLAAQTTTSVIPAFTTANANGLIVGFAMKQLELGSQTSTVATFTERLDQQTTSGTGHVVEVSDKVQVAAGSSGTATVTWSGTTSARALTVSLGLQPTPDAVNAAALTLKADMIGQVNSNALTLKADVIGQVNASALTLKADLIAQVNATARTLKADLVAQVNASAETLLWDLAGPATTPVNGNAQTLKADLFGQVDAAALRFKADVVAQVNAVALNLKSDLVAEVNATALSFKADVIAQVNAAAQTLKADLIAQVDGNTRTLKADVVAQVDAAVRTLKADVIAQVDGAAETLPWDLLSQVDAAARALKADLYAEVGAARTVKWDLVAQVEQAVALSWGLEAQGSVDGFPLRAVWDLAGAVDTSPTRLVWKLLTPVDAAPSVMLWGLTGTATRALALKWGIDGESETPPEAPAVPLIVTDGTCFKLTRHGLKLARRHRERPTGGFNQ